MSAENLFGLGLGTVVFVAVLLGLVYFQRKLRDRLFPGDEGRDRGEAMAELLLLQARLEEKEGSDRIPPESRSESEGPEP